MAEPTHLIEPSDFRFVKNPDLSDSPPLREFKRYWDEKRGLRRMPARADIEPIELREHLGWIYLIDVFADLSDFRYRLLGSRITEIYGRDSTGRTVREVYEKDHPDYCRDVLTLYRVVAGEGVPARGQGSLRIVQKPFRGYDALYLPLGRGDRQAEMILAKLQFR